MASASIRSSSQSGWVLGPVPTSGYVLAMHVKPLLAAANKNRA
jgi:hypothetical protein